MRPEAILYHLAQARGLRGCDPGGQGAARRGRAHPRGLRRVLSGGRGPRPGAAGLCSSSSICSGWREQSAYRPLARLLAGPADQLEQAIGDAVTETSHRVMAAVFDGDPRPLYEAIEAEHADEFARSRMLEAVAMITLAGGLDRAEVATYLRDAFGSLRPHAENFVWHGWQSAIALLGLSELRSLVKEAFERGLIGSEVMDYEDFRGDLEHALAHPDAPWRSGPATQFTLFGDTILELSWWHAFAGISGAAGVRLDPGLAERALNPFRGVGRNDPCPCGSRKKFKRCCLQ